MNTDLISVLKAAAIFFIILSIFAIISTFPTLLGIGIIIFIIYKIYDKSSLTDYHKNIKTYEEVKSGHKLSPLVTPRVDYQIFGNQFMSNEEKQAYLKSDKWKQLCKQVKERDGNKCVISGETNNLEIHHLNYINLGNEQLSDLVTLSRKCHQLQHDHYGYDRTTIYLPLIEN